MRLLLLLATGCRAVLGIDDPIVVGGPDAPAGVPPADSSGPRVAEDLIAVWPFDEQGGAVAHDRSGLPDVPLYINNNLESPFQFTLGAGALTVRAPTLIVSSTGEGLRIPLAIQTSGQLTLEAWVHTDPTVSYTHL